MLTVWLRVWSPIIGSINLGPWGYRTWWLELFTSPIIPLPYNSSLVKRAAIGIAGDEKCGHAWSFFGLLNAAQGYLFQGSVSRHIVRFIRELRAPAVENNRVWLSYPLINVRKAAPISVCDMRCSPTRMRWMPACCRRWISWWVWIPDSLTRISVSCTISTRRRV